MKLRELQEERANLITEMESSLETRDLDGFKTKEARVEEIDGLIAGIEKTRALKDTKNIKNEGEDKKMNLREEIAKDREIDLSKRAITSGVTSSGNVAVGDVIAGNETWESQIVKKAKETSNLLDAVDVVYTGSAHNIPIQGTKIGKFVKVAELGEYAEKNATYGKKQLGAYKYGTLAVISDELLEDADYDIEGDILEQMQDGFAETMDEIIVKGDSEDGIEGLNNFNATITCGGVKKISENDLLEVYYKLPKAYRKKATWVINDQTAKQLSKITDSNGRPLLYTSHNGNPVDETSFILGRPVIINDNVADVAAATVGKCLFFGDLKKALKVGIRKGFTMKKSTDYKFANDCLCVKANARIDSKTVLDEAIVCMQSKIS